MAYTTEQTLIAIAMIRACREAIADYLDPENQQDPERLIDELMEILDNDELVRELGLEPMMKVEYW